MHARIHNFSSELLMSLREEELTEKNGEKKFCMSDKETSMKYAQSVISCVENKLRLG